MPSILFGLISLLSAFLLFWSEPLVAKMILPLFGGTPAVWNTCLMFFQGVLLIGYGYAHVLTRFLTPHRQILLHIVFMVTALAFLPIYLGWLGDLPPMQNPIGWLLLLLTGSLTVPFLLVSATAPLLQYWYGQINKNSAPDPYFLYSASNLGSMGALLAFPLLLEPYLYLQHQNQLWTYLYIFLIILISACTAYVGQRSTPAVGLVTKEVSNLLTPNYKIRLRWLILAFIPSSLLLSTTAYLTTDIAAVPLFWVIPLAIYILTFILVFSRRALIPHRWSLWLQPLSLTLLIAFPFVALNIKMNLIPFLLITFVLYLFVLFSISLVCHGELATSRPKLLYLTEFYLLIALGGLLGGVFNNLIAPILFKDFWEYPIILVLTCFLGLSTNNHMPNCASVYDLLCAMLLCLGFLLIGTYHWQANHYNLLYLLGIVLLLTAIHRPLRFSLVFVVLLFFAKSIAPYADKIPIFQDRNFFGVMKIIDLPNARILFNGTTKHGLQSLIPVHRLKILSYYTPLASLFTPLREKTLKVGIIGLGAGTLACYAKPQDQFVFYEINPMAINIAQDPRYFSFLSSCAPNATIVLGDARLSLQKAPAGQYDMLIFDAFNSDAIPIHLLTQEAINLYLNKLSTHGLLLFHISNRYLNLAPILSVIAHSLQLEAMSFMSDSSHNPDIFESFWVIMARDAHDLDFISNKKWKKLAYSEKTPIWQDDFSNILSALETIYI